MYNKCILYCKTNNKDFGNVPAIYNTKVVHVVTQAYRKTHINFKEKNTSRLTKLTS